MEQWLTAAQLAHRLGVPISWVYDRTRKNGPDRLPFVKLGKYVRFSEAEVLAYLRKNSTTES